MAKLDGVNIEKLQGGLQRLANGTDNHVGLIVIGMPADAVATAVNNGGKGVAITAVYDAEQLGINESYDANNSLTLHQDITEFFRLAPEATLYLFNSDVVADIQAFISQNKEVKGYGIYMTYDSETPNLVTTINGQQTIINGFAAQNRLLDFALIGANGLDDYTEDLRALDAPNTSVLVGCAANDGITALGAALGMLAVRGVYENLGSVDIESKPLAYRGNESYPLTDDTEAVWLNAYLSDGNDIETVDNAVLQSIITNGYIAIAAYQEYPGYFIENSYTCVDEESDFAFIENNRVWNKAARIIRTTLLPRVKGVVKKDPQTGYIAATTAAYWKTLIDTKLDQMVANGEISGYETAIDNKQIVNSTAPVTVKVSIVANGIVHEFEVAVGLTNNI
ncbi:hypothetical protein NBRC110019_07460 [Neptunitalea chrysea]|uniref:DUF2586 family protein n=1 Tax=Neptunitalea chrysea TaxID=1647581 RepID=A0A9W6B4J3_9FLAO|nr:DUF2586 family protein [Neptunitalea chrysea]GLB51707.1 hypothetical protein NBRC110019_07460 [Neptunitalea chrysea]